MEVGKTYSVSLQGFDKMFVACELALDSVDKEMLVARTFSPGEWETFTWTELGDNKVAIQAANGKYVCCDEHKGGLLVADRDYIGEWETFTMVPQDDGTIAIKAWNGKFVTADYGLTGTRKGALFGVRDEVKEWERFVLVKDGAAVQQ